MGTFTIFQTGLIANSYFIPNSDGCNIDLIPVGVVINWDCINDPRDIPDEDYTYVYSSVTDLQYDLYRIPNHTTESGIINFVRIFARAKSADITQHQDGIYKIILTDNACGNIYKSDDIDLITSYSTYNNVWTTNPRTTDAWTWTDIDNLQFGIECSSPSVATTTNSVFRPNATGFHTNMDYSNEGAATTWECVNEASPDEDTTYIRQNVGARYAPISFNLNNPTTEAGAINYVSIFARGKRTSGLANMRSLIRLAGTDKTGTTNTMGSGYVTYSDIHPLTPADDAWTWADISNLEAGVSIYVSAPAGARVTQIYVLVNYNILVNPEIRTTQTYLQVNYTVPSSECELTKPGVISIDHDQNIKMLNFWSGNRVVYGLERNNRTMVMTGTFYSEDACETVECIRGMAESGQDITMAGLGSNNYDRTFKILSFGWKKISDKPLAYEWILESEFT